MKIKILDLENKLGYKIKTDFCSIGFDTAEKCGVSIVKTTKHTVDIDWILLEFDKSNIKNVYKQLSEESLKLLTKKVNFCVLEDTYLKYFWNPKTRKQHPQVDVLKKLTRFGGIILANAINQGIDYEIIGATASRSKFKIKTTGYGRGNSKQGVIDWIKNHLEINLTEDNCCDSICLGLLGICEGMDFKAKEKKKRKK